MPHKKTITKFLPVLTYKTPHISMNHHKLMKWNSCAFRCKFNILLPVKKILQEMASDELQDEYFTFKGLTKYSDKYCVPIIYKAVAMTSVIF